MTENDGPVTQDDSFQLYLASSGSSYTEFAVTLDVIEPMGMETMVYFVVDGVEVCGRVNPAAAGAAGESMRLVDDLNQMHLIDPRTELVI